MYSNYFMKHFLFLLFILAAHNSWALTSDTTTNRYADSTDAACWHNVNEGDYIFFTGNSDGGESIYAGGTVLTLNLPLGKKILIWRGDYRRILIDGKNCVSDSVTPTLVTNLGGQVRWGYSEASNGNRTLELYNFDYLYLTGKYDSLQQTGHEDFLGHNQGENYDDGDFYNRYGLWGNPRWSGTRFNGSFSNIVRIRSFKSLKVDYVAASEGGFAGFNIKTDNPMTPREVEIDVQDCFAGWTESEGFYISWSSGAANQDLTKLTFRNNIMAFCGSESLQSDNLVEGTLIEHNVAFAGACFHRRPFQDQYQDGLHQFSFCEGGVTVRNNVMINGNSFHQLRYKDPGPGRVVPDSTKPVLLKNNYYGFSRSNISYVWEGDGITPYEIDSVIYGPVSTPTTRDAYNNYSEWPHYFKICNNTTSISFKNILYPGDRPLYEGICGPEQVDTTDITTGVAPLILFENSGFSDSLDYRTITFWSAEYGTADKTGQFIPYQAGDIVFYYDSTGSTHFYTCIQSHSGNFEPGNSPSHWNPMNWQGNNLPPLDLRMACNSYYDDRNMGLGYKVDCLTNLDETSLYDRFNIYPNPASDLIQIQYDSDQIESGSIVLSNVLGQVVTTKAITANRSIYESIDVSGLDQGLYFVTLQLGSKLLTKRFIKN